MNKYYYRIMWENYPCDKTPLNEQNLNRMDIAVDEMDNRIISLDSTKFDKSEAQMLVKYIEYDENTGIFKITHYNGASYTIDTLLEKLAINFDYDYQTQRLIIELSDGTVKYVDLSALITQYEFLDSGTIDFQVQGDGKVTAIVKEGSIEEKHLRPNYLADIKVESAKAQTSQKAAAESAKVSESYARGGTGTRPGENTDNSLYYSQKSKEYADSWKGSLLPKGTISFPQLPTSGNVAGHMYNINQAFTTDSRFKEGEGYSYPAGTNVYWTADGKWDCLSGALTMELTQAEYDALSSAEKLNGTIYYISDADNSIPDADSTTPGLVVVDSSLSTSSKNPVQNKIVTTAIEAEAERAKAQEALKAPIASPTFTGTPKAPTPAVSTNNTQIATTAFVKTTVNALVNGAPETLDTLKEIADAIAEHKEVTDALNAAIGNKVSKSGDRMTGGLYIEKNVGDVYFNAKRSDTGTEVLFGVGSGGINHGVFSQVHNKWMLYGDANGIHLNGDSETIRDTLPISKGGTGQTTGEGAANVLLNSLSEGTSMPSDNDYYISQYAGGGTTTTTYHRRPVSKLWDYIKAKLATVAISGSYNDLSNKPSIPTVGNGTVTIKQAGAQKGTFTMNQSGNTTIELADSNNTYSAGNQLTLSGSQFKVSDNCTIVTDWNSAISNGWYMAFNGVHAPQANSWFYGITICHNSKYVRQIVFRFASDNNVSGSNSHRYERIYHNGTWGAWTDTSVLKAVPADAVFTDHIYPVYTASLPADFASKYRTITKGNANAGNYISNIRTDVASVTGAPQFGAGLAWGSEDTHGYLNTAFSTPHAYIGGGNADVLQWCKEIAFVDKVVANTGGTMTGDLVFAAVTSTAYPAKSSKIYWSGSTDGAEIYYQVDDADAGRLMLNMLDDANTRICFAFNYVTKSFIDSSGNFSGRSDKAVRLETARTIGCDGDMVGSISFDGSADKTMTAFRRGCIVGQLGSTNTNPYYKFASYTENRAYIDVSITFHVSCDYGDSSTKLGILTAHIRTNGSGAWESGQLVWEYAVSGIDVSKFRLAHNTASPCIVELWVVADTQYQSYHFDVISEGDRVSRTTRLWTLYDKVSTGSASAVTSGYTVINSTLATVKNPSSGNANTATRLQTAIKIGNASFDGSSNITFAQMGVLPYRTLTQAEYDALPNTKNSDGVMYLIKD